MKPSIAQIAYPVLCTHCPRKVVILDNGTLAQHTTTVRVNTRRGAKLAVFMPTRRAHCYGSGVRVNVVPSKFGSALIAIPATLL